MSPTFDTKLPLPIDFFEACEAADNALTLAYAVPDNVKIEVEEAKNKAASSIW